MLGNLFFFFAKHEKNFYLLIVGVKNLLGGPIQLLRYGVLEG
jgi:hypothetical protein